MQICALHEECERLRCANIRGAASHFEDVTDPKRGGGGGALFAFPWCQMCPALTFSPENPSDVNKVPSLLPCGIEDGAFSSESESH